MPSITLAGDAALSVDVDAPGHGEGGAFTNELVSRLKRRFPLELRTLRGFGV